jgi:hypothetical protein
MGPRILYLSIVLAGAACGGAGRAPSGPSTEVTCELPPEPPAGPPAPACTEMGCVSGYHVTLDPGAGWAPGRYTFDVTADGKHQRCTGALPLTGDCGEPVLRCSGDDLAYIDELNCGGDPADHAFGSIGLHAMPCAVHVTVTRDGTVVAEQAFTPDYRWIEVNGPGCGPRCLQDSDTLVIR